MQRGVYKKIIKISAFSKQLWRSYCEIFVQKSNVNCFLHEVKYKRPHKSQWIFLKTTITSAVVKIHCLIQLFNINSINSLSHHRSYVKVLLEENKQIYMIFAKRNINNFVTIYIYVSFVDLGEYFLNNIIIMT